MSATLTYRHERADLVFTWNGGTQIMIRTGSTVPSWGVYPGRIDVREPDLWRSDLLPAHQRPPHRTGADVVLLPFTQEALRGACDAWWEGREITTGRDFAEYPWQTTVFGSRVDVRYRGGPVIEAAPAGTGHWRTVVDLAAGGLTPAAVTTAWLSRRVNGWSTGVLEHLGIHTPQPVPDPARYGDGTHDAITAWTIRNLPTQVEADSIIGAWHTWIGNTVREVWVAPDGPERWRNAGIAERPVTDWEPWTYQDSTADGTRFNFVWCGGRSVYVTSPDTPRRGTLDGSTFLLHPAELAPGPLLPWLEDQARQWIATCNAAGALTDTPGSLLFHAPWQLFLEGPGVGRHVPFLTKEEAYKAARLARDKAAKGEGISFRSQFAHNDYVSGVRSIRVQRWDSDEGLWRTDNHPWKKYAAAPDALTPYSTDPPVDRP